MDTLEEKKNRLCQIATEALEDVIRDGLLKEEDRESVVNAIGHVLGAYNDLKQEKDFNKLSNRLIDEFEKDKIVGLICILELSEFNSKVEIEFCKTLKKHRDLIRKAIEADSRADK
ncbi:MAG: hypothetical protein CEN90_654 [Parcubacteria group bacterium Licking1014_17]|nr:MAG: hypothetical protein CEN90_654 [Parcubacteria group bacterium Licking1014_17]